MSALTDYVEQHNKWNAIFGKAPLSLAKAADRQRIADMIDGDLSLENLTCDGEPSRSQGQARYKRLTIAARQLKKVDPAVSFYEFEEEIL